ncbi:hypothetical protein [Staphylococcus phage vB_SurM-PSU4]|nr:hypothetical protein [Staphylococcus phage vB_SurM-PSU4]
MNKKIVGLIIDLIEDNNFNTDEEIKESFNLTIERLKNELGITDKDINNYYKNVLHY